MVKVKMLEQNQYKFICVDLMQVEVERTMISLTHLFLKFLESIYTIIFSLYAIDFYNRFQADF